jgi:hypothetical protein
MLIANLVQLLHACNCRFGTTVACIQLETWYNCCMHSTGNLIQLLHAYNCRFGTTVAGIQLQIWYNCCRNTIADLVQMLHVYNWKLGTNVACIQLETWYKCCMDSTGNLVQMLHAFNWKLGTFVACIQLQIWYNCCMNIDIRWLHTEAQLLSQCVPLASHNRKHIRFAFGEVPGSTLGQSSRVSYQSQGSTSDLVTIIFRFSAHNPPVTFS